MSMSEEQAKAILAELAEIKAILGVKPAESAYSNLLPLAEFCKRLGRTHYWGYQQIRARKIIPAKTGKPYLIPVEQLSNFMPTAKRGAAFL